MKPALRFSALATLFVAAAILVSRPTAGGDNQWPLCAKGCVLSYKGYAARSGSSIVTDNTVQGVNPYETLLRASTLAVPRLHSKTQFRSTAKSTRSRSI